MIILFLSTKTALSYNFIIQDCLVWHKVEFQTSKTQYNDRTFECQWFKIVLTSWIFNLKKCPSKNYLKITTGNYIYIFSFVTTNLVKIMQGLTSGYFFLKICDFKLNI